MMRGCLIKLQNDENPDEALKVTTYKYIFYLLVFNLIFEETLSWFSIINLY